MIVYIKNLAYVAMLIASLEWLHVTPVSVAVLSLLILFDIFTGVIKSGYLYGGRSIRSSTLARGVIAKLLLISVPIGVALSGRGINLDLALVAQSAINVLILAEMYSIIGNINALRTGVEKNEFDAVAAALTFINRRLQVVFSDVQK